MKKFLTLFVLALLAVEVNAQSRHPYDCDFKYGFFSNWTLGVSGQYSNQQGMPNIGVSALATKRIGDFWRLRYSATVSGLSLKKGFDRYGTALSGIALDFVPWAYAFADAGVNVNPAVKGWIGLAADAGLGLNVNFGRHSLLYTEAGVDRVQCNGKWGGTFFARLGYAARLGVTEADREAIVQDQTMRSEYGELKQENRLLKTDLKRQQEANDTLVATLKKASDLFAALEKKLDDCNAQAAKAEKEPAGAGPFFQIFFDYASSEVSPIEEAKVSQLADYIAANGGYYRIEGYASPDGNPVRNEALSQERAYAVYWLLVSYGADETHIAPISCGITERYGSDSPLNRVVMVKRIDSTKSDSN